MKQLTIIILVLLSKDLMAQPWQTVTTFQNWGIFSPNEAFKLDVYRNDLWFLNMSNTVKCLHLNTGTVDEIDISDVGEDFDIAFTPSNAYFMAMYGGLYRINSDYTKTNVYSDNLVSSVFQNGDSIYMALQSGFLRYSANGSLINALSFRSITAKGGFFYPSYNLNGPILVYTGTSSDGYEPIYGIDSQMICPQFNDIKFSPYTDTIYVACEKGINIGYNYDFTDSITPTNTVDMPSANVLEFEFDKQNRIWACFGDAANAPFAFARLDGSSWTNIYTAINCPLDFTKYKGMEIDTNGNLWVAENVKIHTLLNPNSPQWLQIEEQKKEQFELSPNPTSNSMQLRFDSNEKRTVTIYNLQGKKMMSSQTVFPILELDVSQLSAGSYFVHVETDTKLGTQKLIVE